MAIEGCRSPRSIREIVITCAPPSAPARPGRTLAAVAPVAAARPATRRSSRGAIKPSLVYMSTGIIRGGPPPPAAGAPPGAVRPPGPAGPRPGRARPRCPRPALLGRPPGSADGASRGSGAARLVRWPGRRDRAAHRRHRSRRQGPPQAYVRPLAGLRAPGWARHGSVSGAAQERRGPPSRPRWQPDRQPERRTRRVDAAGGKPYHDLTVGFSMRSDDRLVFACRSRRCPGGSPRVKLSTQLLAHVDYLDEAITTVSAEGGCRGACR
jgi:hypothetical protein